MDRTRFALSLSLYYTTLFLLLGLQLPYLPLWLESRSLTPTEISVILTIPMIVRLGATPVMAYFADRMPSRGFAILVYSAASAVLYLGYQFTFGFWSIALVTALVSVVLNPLMPITEAVALRGARFYDLDYGRMRLWGSLAFIVANMIGGAVIAERGGPGALIAMNVAAILLALAALGLPRRSEGGEQGGDRADRPKPNMTELFAFLRRPTFAGVMVGSGLIQASHAVFYAFGSIAWIDQGISPTTVGMLWGFGVLVEVALFSVSGRVTAFVGIRGLFGLAAALAVLRWLLMTVQWPVAAYFPIQALHAATFGATHLAAMAYLTDSAPEHQASGAQGLYFMVYGVLVGMATLIAGPLFRAFGTDAYAAMAMIAAIGGLVLWVSLRSPHHDLAP